MPENTVYVGRPTRWGNPFTAGKDGTPAECVEKFAKQLIPYQSHQTGTIKDFLIFEMNLQDLEELRGKDLACWCRPGEPCHADVLLKLANE